MGFLEKFEREKTSILPDQLKNILELAGYTNFVSLSKLSIEDLLESVRGVNNFMESVDPTEKKSSDFIKKLIKPFAEPEKFRFSPGHLAMLEGLKEFSIEVIQNPNYVSIKLSTVKLD